jgi:hypothetical protein
MISDAVGTWRWTSLKLREVISTKRNRGKEKPNGSFRFCCPLASLHASFARLKCRYIHRARVANIIPTADFCERAV